MSIKIGQPGYTIPSSSVIEVENAIVFLRNDKEVARVRAIYETHDLPPELHDTFFEVVNKSCYTVLLPDTEFVRETPVAATEYFPWYRRWLIKLFGR